MAKVTDAHLYPFTLAFNDGLRDGSITLANAGIFVERVYDAWLEARVQANPALLKDPLTAGAHKAITDTCNSEE
jgi:hypothetical protein